MRSSEISEGNITGRKQKKNPQNRRLTTTASREVAQRLASTISEGVLDREARVAESVLRVRTRPEFSEDKGLMQESNPNCEIARNNKKHERELSRKRL